MFCADPDCCRPATGRFRRAGWRQFTAWRRTTLWCSGTFWTKALTGFWCRCVYVRVCTWAHVCVCVCVRQKERVSILQGVWSSYCRTELNAVWLALAGSWWIRFSTSCINFFFQYSLFHTPPLAVVLVCSVLTQAAWRLLCTSLDTSRTVKLRNSYYSRISFDNSKLSWISVW